MKISEITPAADALTGTEVFPLNQGGVTKLCTVNQLLDFITASGGGGGGGDNTDIGYKDPYTALYSTSVSGTGTFGIGGLNSLAIGFPTAPAYGAVISVNLVWVPDNPGDPAPVVSGPTYGGYVVTPQTVPGYSFASYPGTATIRFIINGATTVQSLRFSIGSGTYSSMAWAHYAS